MDLAEILQGLASNDLEELKRQDGCPTRVLQGTFWTPAGDTPRTVPTLDNLLARAWVPFGSISA